MSVARQAMATPASSAERHVALIEALDKRLVGIERALQTLDEARGEARRAEARARSKEAANALQLRRAEAALGRRLGTLSRRRPAADVVWRLGAKRLSLWLDEERLHRAVAEHDHRLVTEVRATRASLSQATQARTQALALITRSENERRQVGAALGRERRRRLDALERLARAGDRRTAVAALHRLGDEQLGDVLHGAQGEVNGRSVATEGLWPTQAAPPRVPPGEMSHEAARALPWPADGRVRVRFGDRVDLAFGTVTRHNGLDIGAPAGARVRAVARGQVVFADWLPGYGQTVIVAHPHQVHSVHAHLSHISVQAGQGVDGQQCLGFVGDTGSLRGHVLYFELRKRGQPEDPLRWLKAPNAR